jgi:hypothetical protein
MEERAPTGDETARVPHGKNWEPLSHSPLRTARKLRVVCIGVSHPFSARPDVELTNIGRHVWTDVRMQPLPTETVF